MIDGWQRVGGPGRASSSTVIASRDVQDRSRSEHEVLPDHDAQLVTAVIEPVRLVGRTPAACSCWRRRPPAGGARRRRWSGHGGRAGRYPVRPCRSRLAIHAHCEASIGTVFDLGPTKSGPVSDVPSSSSTNRHQRRLAATRPPQRRPFDLQSLQSRRALRDDQPASSRTVMDSLALPSTSTSTHSTASSSDNDSTRGRIASIRLPSQPSSLTSPAKPEVGQHGPQSIRSCRRFRSCGNGPCAPSALTGRTHARTRGVPPRQRALQGDLQFTTPDRSRRSASKARARTGIGGHRHARR